MEAAAEAEATLGACRQRPIRRHLRRQPVPPERAMKEADRRGHSSSHHSLEAEGDIPCHPCYPRTYRRRPAAIHTVASAAVVLLTVKETRRAAAVAALAMAEIDGEVVKRCKNGAALGRPCRRLINPVRPQKWLPQKTAERWECDWRFRAVQKTGQNTGPEHGLATARPTKEKTALEAGSMFLARLHDLSCPLVFASAALFLFLPTCVQHRHRRMRVQFYLASSLVHLDRPTRNRPWGPYNITIDN